MAPSAPEPPRRAGGRFAGFPNGRRLEDDVTTSRCARSCAATARSSLEGESFGSAPPNRTPNNLLGDGVDANDRPFRPRSPTSARPSGLRARHHGAMGGPSPTSRQGRRSAGLAATVGLFGGGSPAGCQEAAVALPGRARLRRSRERLAGSSAPSRSLRARPRPPLARWPRARLPAARPRDRDRPTRRLGPRAPARDGDGAASPRFALSRHDFRRRSRSTARVVARARLCAGSGSSATRSSSSAATTRRSPPSTDGRPAKPGLAAYARIAYARELIGRPLRAIAAMARPRRGAAARPSRGVGARRDRQARILAAASWTRRCASTARRCRLPRLVPALDAPGAGRGGARCSTRRSRSRGAPWSRSAAQFVGSSATSTAPPAETALAREQYALVGAIDRLLARTGSHGPRDGALRRRPRHRAGASARPRPRARTRPADDRRRRRPRLGARAHRPLRARRCASRARAAARHARRAQVFHRGMIEHCLGDAAAARGWFRRALALNPHFSLRWAPVAERLADEARRRPARRACWRSRRPRRGAPARQLHGQPLQRHRAVRRPDAYVHYGSTWPRSRPSRRARAFGGRIRGAGSPAGSTLSSTDRRALEVARPAATRASGRRRSGDAPLRGGLRAPRRASRLSFQRPDFARLGWREVVVDADRGARGLLQRPRAKRRATSCAPTRRPCSRARWTSPRRPRRSARRRPRRSAAARRRSPRPRTCDGGFEALVERDLSLGFVLALAAARASLGRRARAQPGSRQGDRRRLPRRDARPPRDAVVLGAIVTVTHTIGVFALGLVTLASPSSSSRRSSIPG